jgi:endonuclease YncB( thermonuclease family)
VSTATPSPTETAKPTEEATPSATSEVLAQSPSLASEEIAAQAGVSGAFRYTVESAARGVELPEYALPNPGDGEWVVLIVDALNWSGENATLNMSDFRIAPTAALELETTLDPTTDAVASFLNLTPAYTSSASILFAPGENHRIALVFLLSTGTGDLSLLAGGTTINLGDALAQAGELGDAPREPKLIEATVLNVIDGRTIEVDVKGVTITVQYLGITVPTGDACYAAQATAANSTLVSGQTVWLERERKNRAGDGVARDVWVQGAGGNKFLVAQALVESGAAAPAPVEPDIRFAGVLAAAAESAQLNNAGAWGACGGFPAE